MKSVILIDVAGLFFQFWHATVDQPFGEAFTRTVDRVHSLAQGFDHAVVCYDWGPYKRKAFSEAYKAQRDAPEAVLTEQYKRTRERLSQDGFPVIGSKGYEADDIIATIVDKLRGSYVIRVASGDKDLMVLVNDADNVSLMSTRTGEVYKEDGVLKKFGVLPVAITDFLSLTGDKADNIIGVPGVGQVIASKILNSPEGINGVLSGEEIEGVTPRIQNLVKDNIEAINLARKLVTLMTDAPIDVDDIFKERKALPLAENKPFEEEESMPEKVTEAEFTDETPSAPRTAELRDDERLPDVPALHVPPPTPTKFAEPKPQTTALAKVAVRFEDELEPRTLGNASILSDKIVNSRLYSNFGNSDAALGIILSGREMGLRAMESLRAFHLVEGKPTMHAHLIIARAKQHQDCEYFQMIESTGTKAVYETKNRKNRTPTRLEYTLEQAQQSGLAPEVMRPRKVGDGKDSRGNWEKRPDEMLRKTCAVQLARIEYPDSAMGLYSPEEMGAEV